jgi:hypothetical protein
VRRAVRDEGGMPIRGYPLREKGRQRQSIRPRGQPAEYSSSDRGRTNDAQQPHDGQGEFARGATGLVTGERRSRV